MGSLCSHGHTAVAACSVWHVEPVSSVQGFATGDCDRDGQAIRTFLDDGHNLGCSQSYAKNMGLYGQRIGCLSLVCADKAEASAVESQVKVRALQRLFKIMTAGASGNQQQLGRMLQLKSIKMMACGWKGLYMYGMRPDPWHNRGFPAS